MNAVNQLLEG